MWWIVVHLALAAALAACAGRPVAPPPERPLSDAERIFAEGAGLPKRERAELYLDALLRRLPDAPGADAATARELAAELQRAEGGEPLHRNLPRSRRFAWRSAALQLALATGDMATARRLFNLRPGNAEEAVRAAMLRASVLERLRQHERAARQLLSVMSATATQDVGINDRIWQNIVRSDPRRWPALATDAKSAMERAWWSLALGQQEALTTRSRLGAWRQWQRMHPEHAASAAPPSALAALGRLRHGVRIALLLPLSGPLASAGRAIRDGFTAAYLVAGPRSDDALAVLDTTRRGAADAYRRAVSGGAELIVGPLSKEAVASVAALPPSVPTVALNALDEGSYRNFVQLAYAIEDEATAIARALAEVGLERVLLLGVSTPWSARAASRLRAEMATLDGAPDIIDGGAVADVRSATGALGKGLGVEASQDRHRELARMLRRELEFVPRRRDDIDAIVALVGAAQMTALMPALDFHSGLDIPLYVTSTAIRGVALRRLSDVRVCGVPWQPGDPALGRILRSALPGTPAARALHALGADAFRIGHRFVQPAVVALPATVFGSTGPLTIGTGLRVSRAVNWSRIVNGRFVPWSPELELAGR